jgi:uncharacterized membrane protein
MAKRIRKAQVIAKMKAQDIDRLDTFQKTWMLKNGTMRYGWWRANFHGWTLVGETLADCMYSLELQEEMDEQYRDDMQRAYGS